MSTLRLIPYELRKNLTSRVTLLFLVLLLGGNLFLSFSYAKDVRTAEEERLFPELQAGVENVYALYQSDPARYLSEYERVVREFEDLTSRTVSRVYAKSPAEDYSAFQEVDRTVRADKYYHETLTQLVEQTRHLNQSLLYLSANGENSYSYRNNEKVAEIYDKLNETVHLDDKKVTGWDTYFTYPSEFFMTAGAITLLVVTMAVSDHKSGFAAIIGTAKYGRQGTVTAKFCVALLLSLTITLLMAISSFLMIGSVIGYSDPGNAVQAAPSMEMFPMQASMAEVTVLSFVCKILSALAYGTVLFALASLVKSYAFGIGMGFGFVGISYWISGLDPTLHGQWININFTALYRPSAFLSRYRTVNFLEHAADLRIVMPILTMLLIVCSLLLALFAASKHRIGRRVKIRRKLPTISDLWGQVVKYFPKRKTGRRHSVSFTVYELYKQKWLFLVLLILLVIKVGNSAEYFTPSDSIYDLFRQEYLQKIEGEYSEEKKAYLEAESERLLEISAKEDEMADAYEAKTITDDEYSAYFIEMTEAGYRQPVVNSLLDKAKTFEKKYAQAGVLGSFLYDAGYNKYMDQGVDFLLLLFLVLCGSRFYLVEQERRSTESPMYALVQASRNGRGKLFWRKLGFHFAVTTAVFAIFKGIDLYFFLARYPHLLWDAKLFSISRYSGVPLGMTVRGYLLLTLALSYLGTLVLSLLTFLTAVWLKKTVITYAALAAGLCIPHFVVLAGQRIGNFIDLTQLYDTDRLLRYSLGQCGDFRMAAIFFVVVCLLTAAYFAFSMHSVKKGIKV